MRSRIVFKRVRKYVTYAVDECMQSLPAQKLHNEPEPPKPAA